MFNCPDELWRLGVWALITCLEKFKLPNDLSGGAKFCPYTNFVTHLYGSAKVFGDRRHFSFALGPRIPLIVWTQASKPYDCKVARRVKMTIVC